MCPNSCVAYTGPFSTLEICPKCGETRYDPIKLASSGGKTKVPRQEFYTILLGPQLQALWRTPQGAEAMRYRERKTQEILDNLEHNEGVLFSYDDFYFGSDYLNAVMRGNIGPEDTVLLFSMDGAQLYQNKTSDCWIYIWVVLNYSPDGRYKVKKVLSGGFIPGPNKPQVADSFLYPGLHHLAALQINGLPVWDAQKDKVFLSRPFLVFATADGPGMTYLNGLVGHHGAFGCRFYCPLKGRHKPDIGHYFPALLKPNDYNVIGSDHDDVDVRNLPPACSEEYDRNLAHLLASENETQFKTRRRETGISKPSLFSALVRERMLGIPGCFPGDLMHLVSLNLTDLLISLWRGTIDCDPTDNKALWDCVRATLGS
jgi:hypothetical protein